MRKYELIAEYLIAQLYQAENDVQEYQRRLKFRKVEMYDCYELQLALYKLELLQEITKNITVFLRLGVKDYDEKVGNKNEFN